VHSNDSGSTSRKRTAVLLAAFVESSDDGRVVSRNEDGSVSPSTCHQSLTHHYDYLVPKESESDGPGGKICSSSS